MHKSSNHRKGMSHSEAGKLGAIKSKSTHTKNKQLRIIKYNKNPKLCNFCNKPLNYNKRNNKFCGHSCSASFNNKGIRRHGEAAGFCITCSENKANASRKYCSNKCQWNHFYKEIINTGSLEGRSPRTIRKFMIKYKGLCCEICGIKKWRDKPVPVVVDHIDGHADNNLLNNLRVICCNCNALLPTYAGRNKGNGRRQKRRKRYAEGKTY